MIKEDLLVHLLEVESEIQCAADAGILEFFTPDVERECLHNSGAAIWKFLQQHAFFADGWKIIGGGPVLGAVFRAPIDLVAFEGLESNQRVSKIFITQLIKIA